MGEFVTMREPKSDSTRDADPEASAGRVVLYLIVAFFAVMFMGPFVDSWELAKASD